MAIQSTHRIHVRTSAGATSTLTALTEADAKTQAEAQRALGNTVTHVREDTTVADVAPKKK